MTNEELEQRIQAKKQELAALEKTLAAQRRAVLARAIRGTRVDLYNALKFLRNAALIAEDISAEKAGQLTRLVDAVERAAEEL